MRVVDFKDLYERKGIRWSRPIIMKKIAEEGFPRPFKISERRMVFSEAEVDRWLEERAQDRITIRDL